MQPINTNHQPSMAFKRQLGATLFTSLIFLTLMTIVTVSATKISIIDILVAGNDQQQVEVFHQIENELTDFTDTVRLSVPLDRQKSGQTFGNGGAKVNGIVTDNNTFSFADVSPNTVEIITDLEEIYSCLREGVGSSLGPNAPVCRLYDFQLRKSGERNKLVRDQHHQGAGKMVPNSKSKGSFL